MKVEVAREAGVSAGFITAVLRGRKRPGPKVLAYLGLEAYESYRRAPRARVASVAAMSAETSTAPPT